MNDIMNGQDQKTKEIDGSDGFSPTQNPLKLIKITKTPEKLNLLLS